MAALVAGALTVTCGVGLYAQYLRIRSGDADIKLVWAAETGQFDWAKGSIYVPVGFRHTKDHGIDTLTGRLTSSDGRTIIHYDIGYLAGEHGHVGTQEYLVNGARVRLALRLPIIEEAPTRYFSSVSFPDNGCANFYADSADGDDAPSIIERIATSFRPHGAIPSWIRPILPEPLRRDCRYRWRFPDF